MTNLIRNKNKGNRRRHSYTKTSVPKSSKPKQRKERKKRKFESSIPDTPVNMIGTYFEYIVVILKIIVYAVGFVGGLYMVFKDIRDNGSFLELGTIKYSGTMVGVIVIIVCAFCIWRSNAYVKLSKKT